PTIPALGQPAQARLLVANQQSASASIIELSTGAVTTIDVGTGPHEAAITPDGKWGVISIYGTQPPGNQLALIDMEKKAIAKTISLGAYTRPHHMTILPGAPLRIAVTSETTQNLVIVNMETGVVEGTVGTRAAGSHMATISSD